MNWKIGDVNGMQVARLVYLDRVNTAARAFRRAGGADRLRADDQRVIIRATYTQDQLSTQATNSSICALHGAKMVGEPR